MIILTKPIVKLSNAFSDTYKNSLATARSCYSKKIITEDDIKPRHDFIANQTFNAGHHTVWSHGTFQFTFEKVSRHFLWSFLNTYKYANLDQQSQRYVQINQSSFIKPDLKGKNLEVFNSVFQLQYDAYLEIIRLLYSIVCQQYQKIFPHRNLNDKSIASGLHKKALEVARYVLPIGMLTNLYFTSNLISFLRFYQSCKMMDLPEEQFNVFSQVIDTIYELEPKYRDFDVEPLPAEELPDLKFFSDLDQYEKRDTKFIAKSVDIQLRDYVSKLDDWNQKDPVINIQESLELIFGIQASVLDVKKALMALSYGASVNLDLNLMSRIGDIAEQINYTFVKKLSHSADSQNQRHRASSGVRPLVSRFILNHPDYITPSLIKLDNNIEDFYNITMEKIWNGITKLRKNGVSPEVYIYLLPNAVSVRIKETTDLLGLIHKYKMRLCYLAQEEIWRASLDEVKQISNIHPEIGSILLPPCTHRWYNKIRPVCPEGDRFCGISVWQKQINEYKREI